MERNNLQQQVNRKKIIFSCIKIAVLIAIVVGIPTYIYFYQRDVLTYFKSVEDVVLWLEGYKAESMVVYVLLQILQIVISVLPGQAFQLAAGYLYGFPIAIVLALAGAVAGTTITFFLAKILGSDFVHIFFAKDKTDEYITKLNSKRAYTVVFLLYLIPGIPKDVVSYAAGLSEMKFKPFIMLSSIGRIPGMAGSIMMGSMLNKEAYFGMIVLGIIAVAAFVLCIVYRKRIHELIDKVYDKISK